MLVIKAMENENRTNMHFESESKTSDISINSLITDFDLKDNSVIGQNENGEEINTEIKVENLLETNVALLVNSEEKHDNPEEIVEECLPSENSKISNLGNKFFFTEVMATAGPRKNFQEDAREGDHDLGEDVVGCFVRNSKAFFWLLDGTSDNPIYKNVDNKEIISSRLLSQDVAWHMQRIIWDKNLDLNSEEVLRECFISILKDWQDKLNNLCENDKERLLALLSIKTTLTVSSTVIFGTFDIDGNLNLSQVGDSYIVTNPINDFPKVTGRFFVLIKATPDNTGFAVGSNSFEDTRCQTFNYENVNTLVVVTDGISQNTIKWLLMKPADFTDPAFRKTISAIKHGTCDDKALCVIQLISND